MLGLSKDTISIFLGGEGYVGVVGPWNCHHFISYFAYFLSLTVDP